MAAHSANGCKRRMGTPAIASGIQTSTSKLWLVRCLRAL
jgi:hypothetical protein